jgi:nucleoside-diphosphate-sugar epimerase
VRGINLVMEGSFVEPINLGNPEEVTIVQIAREVRDAVPGNTSEIVHLPQPEVYKDDPKVRCPDITRAKQILGWTPQVPRAEGLKKMIEFYRAQLARPGSPDR